MGNAPRKALQGEIRSAHEPDGVEKGANAIPQRTPVLVLPGVGLGVEKRREQVAMGCVDLYPGEAHLRSVKTALKQRQNSVAGAPNLLADNSRVPKGHTRPGNLLPDA